MYKTKQELSDAFLAITKTIDAVLAELGDTNDASKITTLKGTDEEKFAEFDRLLTEQKSMRKELARWENREKAKVMSQQIQTGRSKFVGVNFNPGTKAEGVENEDDYAFSLKDIRLPNKAKAVMPRTVKSRKAAYAIGMWAISQMSKNRATKDYAGKWCDEHLNMKALAEGSAASGSALVPYEFLPILVNLIEQYGRFRQNQNVIPMSESVMPFPRVSGHVSASWEDENDQPTESAPTFNNVQLIAKKLFGWLAIPYELVEDSAIAIGDWVMKDYAWKFSQAEDLAGFNGDGTSTYGKVMGLFPLLTGLSGTVANIAGIQQAATGHTTFATIDRADVLGTFARLPAYVYTQGKPKIYCSSVFYYNTLRRLALSQGGSTATEMVDGVRRLVYDGWEVVLTQVMPLTDAVSQCVMGFGDISMAGKMGDRRQFTIATSEHVRFLNDQFVTRATERIAITNHDVGNASATASARVAGPFVALMTAAS